MLGVASSLSNAHADRVKESDWEAEVGINMSAKLGIVVGADGGVKFTWGSV